MPARTVRRLDLGYIEEVANGIQAMGFSGDQGRARRRSAECSLRKRSAACSYLQEYFPSRLDRERIILSDQGTTSKNARPGPSALSHHQATAGAGRGHTASQTQLIEVEPRARVTPDHFRLEFAFRQVEKRFAGTMQRYEIIGTNLLQG